MSDEANMKEGKPSLAIALSTQRHGKKKKMAMGGMATNTNEPKMPNDESDTSMRPAIDQYMGSKMAEGGEVGPADLMSDDERSSSIAEAIMRKRKMMADGGMVDLDANSEEHSNEYDDLNEDAANEPQSDDSQISAQPEDSNEKGDSREDDSENKRDMISAIRAKLKAKRGA